MEWDHKFNTIIQETESNLAKVKQHLGSARSSSYSTLTSPSGLYQTSLSPVLKAHKSVSFGNSPNSPRKDYSTLSRENLHIDQSPAVSLLLKDRLDEQNRTIENMSRVIKSLEDERSRQQSQMKHMQDELSSLSNRVAERGIDLQTERKVEHWKREMYSDMKLLQNQVDKYRSHDPGIRYNDADLKDAQREIQQTKRFVQEECNSLRRDFEHVKSRLVKLELELTSTSADSKDTSRRQDRLDRVVREISDSQKSHSRELNRTLGDIGHDQSEIVQLRSTVMALRDKIDSLESRSWSYNVQSPLPRKVVVKRDVRPRKSSPVHSNLTVSSLSDLDLSSDTSLADHHSDEFDISLTTSNKQRRIKENDIDDELDDLELSDAETASTLDFDDL